MKKEHKSIAADVLLDAVCAVVSLLAARSMLNDVYGWGRFDFGSVTLACVMAFALSLGMELTFLTEEKRGSQIRLGILGGGVLIFIGYLWFSVNWEIVSSGVRKMISIYTAYFDSYYGTEIAIVGGHSLDIPDALSYSLVLLLFLVLWAAKMLKNNLILAIPSVMVFATELMVGYSPTATGIFLMFVGIALANASGFKFPGLRPAAGTGNAKFWGLWRFSWVLVAVCIGFGGAQLQKHKTDSAKELVNSAESIRDVLEELLSVFRADNPDISTSGGKLTHELNNDTPQYREQKKMQIWMSDVPQGPLYLKGYSADYYEDGVWSTRAAAFKRACAGSGFDDQIVGIGVVNLGVEKLVRNYGVNSLAQGMFGKEFRIFSYTDTGDEVYVPYFSEIESEQLGIVADSHYYKTESFRTLNMTIWYYENQYKTRLDHFTSNGDEDWEAMYEEYIETNYLDVPDDLPSVEQIASQLGGIVIIGTFTENDRRLAIAQMVAKWMEENTIYSLEPPEMPAGSDPIEYFLGTSRTGYCMHYASASVMLLRELGVPARFATGYVASEDSFAASGDGYAATVIDRQAHAWAEIYLSGIGWVPFEVTKGYQDSVPNYSDNEPETQSSEEQSRGEDEQSSAADVDASDEESSGEGSTEESTAARSDGETTTLSGTGGDSDRSVDLKKIVRIVLPVVGVMLMLTVMIYAIVRLRKEYQERLLREIRRRQHAGAIRLINRRIYRKLRMTGKVMKLNLRDDGYEEILKRTYPEVSAEDWDRFMSLVKAAAFSKREFTEEEVRYCYRIYRIVKPHS